MTAPSGRRPARLLHLVSESGRSAYFSAFAERFDRQQLEVSLATLPPEGDLNRDMNERGVPSFSLQCHSRRDYPRAVWALAAHLRKQRIDILQVHLLDASLVGLLAARMAGTPVGIFTGHHSHEVILRNQRLLLAADRLCSRWLSHYVIVHCQQMKTDLLRAEGGPGERVAVIPLGFDLDRWQPSPDGRERVRRELGLVGKTVLGAIGRLFWVKDYPRLFRALVPHFAAHPDLTLLILGDGPDRTALEQLCADLQLQQRIVFAGKRPDVVDCLAAMDLFVHAALSESFCQVLVEAQIAGLPLVSTAVGIAPELIEEGVNGFLVPTANEGALRRGLQVALDSRPRWKAMGADGQRRCRRYSIVATVEAHQRQYLAWLSERT